MNMNSKIKEDLQFTQRYSVTTASRLAEESDTDKFNMYLELEYDIPGDKDHYLKLFFERVHQTLI